MSVGMAVEGVTAWRAKLRRAMNAAPKSIREINARSGPRLVAIAEEAAPVLSGTLAAGFYARFEDAGLAVFLINDTDYYLRKELGFVGVDSLGRHYADAPIPMARKAMEEEGPRWKSEIQRAVPGWFK